MNVRRIKLSSYALAMLLVIGLVVFDVLLWDKMKLPIAIFVNILWILHPLFILFFMHGFGSGEEGDIIVEWSEASWQEIMWTTLACVLMDCAMITLAVLAFRSW